ncbi:MAG: transcription antitermination factor NusB [Gemmatimonadales bacterium]|nr:transcription antitermination factor NusB [Gemmatimonadales bacterium]
MRLRTETRGRARALQLLYAAETLDRPLASVVPGLAKLTGPEPTVLDLAERLAQEVWDARKELDALLQDATDNWRIERLAAIDRNILRIGAYELRSGQVPPRVAIDEALWVAHRFGTPQSPPFVNGVLDRVARSLGLL